MCVKACEVALECVRHPHCLVTRNVLTSSLVWIRLELVYGRRVLVRWVLGRRELIRPRNLPEETPCAEHTSVRSARRARQGEGSHLCCAETHAVPKMLGRPKKGTRALGSSVDGSKQSTS